MIGTRRWLGASLVPLVAVLAGMGPLAAIVGDVPFVPTPQVVVDEMLRVGNVGPQDVLYDLGSGDGRIVITAAWKFGARGVGVELNPELVAQSEEGARQAGVESRVKFLQQDLFKADLAEATVITMYLLPAVNRRLRPHLLNLRPGTRIVAHDFDLDEWRPDQVTTIRKNVFLWVVPAKVAGRWRAQVALPDGARSYEIEFRQTFQNIDGLARMGGQPAQMWETRLRGDRISFVIVDDADRDHETSLYFDGHVAGNAMLGELKRGVGNVQTTVKWQAVRVGP
jgi:SAM-dependent methyltransferase